MADDLNDVTDTDDDEVSESSEALIAVHWRDEGYYPPPPSFVRSEEHTSELQSPC